MLTTTEELHIHFQYMYLGTLGVPVGVPPPGKLQNHYSLHTCTEEQHTLHASSVQYCGTRC